MRVKLNRCGITARPVGVEGAVGGRPERVETGPRYKHDADVKAESLWRSGNFSLDPSGQSSLSWAFGSSASRSRVNPTKVEAPGIKVEFERGTEEVQALVAASINVQDERDKLAATKDLKSARKPINARAETLATSPMFKAPFARRRCLVPAGAFYEWRKPRLASSRAPLHKPMGTSWPLEASGKAGVAPRAARHYAPLP
jgi:hypothetical protein